MRKAAKRIITVVLTVALCVGLVSTAAFAGSAVLPDLNNDKVKYVALGDSMTQGYQFTDYNESFADGHYCGFAGTSDRSYITMFANDLAEKFGAENFQLVDLTVQGFQPDELYYMFKWLKGEADDVYLTPGAQKHINWWTKDQGTENNWVFEDTKTMCETYVNSLAAADIITYDIGMNYFGTYLTDRIWGEESQQGAREDSYTYFLDKISPEASAMVEALRTKLISTFVKDEKTSWMVDNLIDGMLYAYCSFIYYFDKSVECIYEVNPDVDMIVMPLFSPHQGLSIDLGGVIVNHSEMLNLMMDSLNMYVAMMNKNSAKYKYCDYESSPMSFADELYYNSENASDDVKELVFQTFQYLIGDSTAKSLQPVPQKIQEDIVACDGYWYMKTKNGQGDFIIKKDKTTGTYPQDADGNYLYEVSEYDKAIYKLIADKHGDDVAFETFFGPYFFTMAHYDTAGAIAIMAKDQDYAAITIKYGYSVLFPGASVMQENMDTNHAQTASLSSHPEFVANARQAIANGTAKDYQIYLVEAVDAYNAQLDQYRDAWWDACVKATSYRTYPADLLYTFLMYGNTADVLSAKGYDIDYTRTMFDPENATDEDYLALHWELRHGSAARGFGAHPCPLGQVEKYNTVTRAYNGESTNADVVVRTATNGFKFVSDFTNKILDFTHDLFAKIGTTLKVMFRWPNVVDTLLKFLPFIPGC